MTMTAHKADIFSTIRTEGSLLPADLLHRISEGDPEISGLAPDAYHLPKGERLNEAVNRSWSRLRAAWIASRQAKPKAPAADAVTTVTRERWILPIFQELGYGRLPITKAVEIDGKAYPVSRIWQNTPIHVVSPAVDLDTRTAGVAGAARNSPHGLLQELLNRAQAFLWGFVTNGRQFRILRDNVSLTRQAYVEFDLEAMMEGEVYADFALFWLLCHQSRVEAETPDQCWLEKWSRIARERGTRALDQLRNGVEEAIRALGQGFLSYPANQKLRDGLKSGKIAAQDYYRQLLRLVYRLLFLFAAEDRDLLLAPKAEHAARERFARYYSTARLRRLASLRRGTKHPDLYRGLCVVIDRLGSDDGCPALGLPSLGSFIWSPDAISNIAGFDISNNDLLSAVRALAFTSQDRLTRPVDYKNLGAEELGSVYESLLELHPEINADSAVFELKTTGGHERKTTGSYYTPSSLIQCLLDSALVPVLDEAAKKPDPEKAILGLKICDPACGSGHFLIAAAHRIAKRLAAVRTGDDEPSPEAMRHALRNVIGHCIYSVDINPMAVELCKVSLWMESLEPGMPLSFLDHHIRCGNSLFGATPELIANGIPDEAFETIEGDDKRACAALRKLNARERQGFGDLFSRQDQTTQASLQQAAAALEELPGDRLEDIRTKEQAFRHHEQTKEYQQKKQLADAWCAAFVISKHSHKQGREARASGITQCLLNDLARGKALPADLAAEVKRLSSQYQFFHWHLAFPEVFDKSGFDCMLGNPPWERVKLQEEEFFAVREPAIAKAKNAAERKKMIAVLPTSNPALAKEWGYARRRAESESNFLRLSGRYPLGGVGDVNTYAVFADLFQQSISPEGIAALLLPNGLVTGFTYRAFLQHLLQSQTLASFYGLENEDKIFPSVHNETKFGVLTMTGRRRPVVQPWFTAHLRKPEQVHDPLRRYVLTSKQIEAINPNTLSLPAFRWAADAKVAAAIHDAAPVLLRRYEDGRIENPWKVTFRSLFHMANDSSLFIDHAVIAPRIVERRSILAVLDDGSKVYPLYEGKMLWHFDHRYGSYANQTQKQANKGVLPHIDDNTHNDPEYRVQPRYWVSEEKMRAALGKDVYRDWVFSWRDVGISERSFIGCIAPLTAAGDKAPFLVSNYTPREVTTLAGLLSSLVVDYDARQRSGSMKFFVVEQLAVLPPTAMNEPCPWSNESVCDWMVKRVLELSYTSVDLTPFARDIGISLPPFRWSPERRILLQAEINAAALHLYRLTRPQAEWLLDSFTVLRDYEERDNREFRTKRIILEIYDAMQESIRTGQPYQTRLNPPPADPRCCHPART